MCSVGDMTDPLIQLPRTSANGTSAGASEPVETVDPPAAAYADSEPEGEAPPGAPRWVKALGIVLVVLLLVFAGLHLTGNAPTHMAGGTGEQHGIQLP
jgi:hypothetical protein